MSWTFPLSLLLSSSGGGCCAKDNLRWITFSPLEQIALEILRTKTCFYGFEYFLLDSMNSDNFHSFAILYKMQHELYRVDMAFEWLFTKNHSCRTKDITFTCSRARNNERRMKSLQSKNHSECKKIFFNFRLIIDSAAFPSLRIGMHLFIVCAVLRRLSLGSSNCLFRSRSFRDKLSWLR